MAVVYDLKREIEARTGIKIEDQGLSVDSFPDEMPLQFVAEHLDGTPILLFNLGKSTPAPKKVPERRIEPPGPAPMWLDEDDHGFNPYMRGNTKINTNANAKYNIGTTITPNDFRKLLDLVEIDSDLFTQQFEYQYSLIHPNFTGGPFSEFYQKRCVQQKEILYLSLHPADDTKYTDARSFKNLILTNPMVCECFKTIGVGCWVGEVSDEIAATYKQVFGTGIKYPFMALVGHIGNQFTILDFHNEGIVAVELVEKIQNAMSEYARIVNKLEQEELRRATERMEVEEQDREFKETQRRDAEQAERTRKEKEAEAREKEEAKQQQEDMEKLQEAIRASQRFSLEDARNDALAKFAALPPEPARTSVPKPARIGMRLPDGSRIDRFFSTQAPFQQVLDWVSGVVATKLTEQNFLDDNSPPLDSSGLVVPWTISAYELVLNSPQKSLSCDNAQETLEALQLIPQAMLFLQRKN